VLLFSTSAFAAEDVIEEIVVTGSYIKRDNFDTLSPTKIITQDDISAQATPALGEIMANQTFNFGSDIFANGYARRYQEGNVTNANLRGLGAGATLQLMDGKRVSQSNLNNMLPQIAIERIDILKDGASALYGSDAVAGVVNIVPRKNVDTAELMYFNTQDSRGDHSEDVLDFIFGSGIGEKGNFTFAAEWRKRDALTQQDRPEYRFPDAFARSETGNPGSYLVPGRDAAGALTGASSQLPDPGCGLVDGPGGTNESRFRNNISGQVKYNGQVCYFYFGEWFNYVNDNKQLSTYANYQYEFADNLHMELDFQFSKQNTHGRSSNSNPGGRLDLLPPILGEHPGNPYRAMADRGNGMEPIFALDNGSGAPVRDAAGVVQLAPDPYTQSAGTVPFNEDVVISALRLFGKLGNQPTNGRNNDGSNTAEHTFDRLNWRLVNSWNYEIPESSWELSFSASYQRNETDEVRKNASLNAVLLGLDGLLGVDRDEYYNPFSTVQFDCVDRVCTDSGNPTYANSDDVVNSVDIMSNFNWYTNYYVYDFLATGDLFDLPAGTVGAAVGISYTDYEQVINETPAANRCDRWINGCAFDYTADRDTQSAFFEVIIPVLNGGFGGELELQLAGRYTDYSDVGDTFDPKIAFRWAPVEVLAFRGSFSTAFIAPSLTQLFTPKISFLQTVDDPLSGDQGTFRTNTFNGNPDLISEEADVYNIGFSLSLLDGNLTFGADYTKFDFVDRIATTNAQNVIDKDFANFLAAGGDVNNPADVAAWIAPGGGGDPGLIRGPSGTLSEILTSYVNAQTMDVESYDFYATYRLDTSDLGNFVFDLGATWMDKYEYDLGDGLSGDGVGKQNDTIGAVPPTPEWRIIGGVNWSFQNHHVMLRGRWTDSITLDGLSTGLNGLAAAGSFATLAFIDFCDKPSCYRNVIDDELLIDLSYSYTWENLIGDRRTRVEIGARNLTDELPDIQMTLGGMDTFVSDPRGRMLYLRLNQDI
jgi:outer membrane receptor protein involved in Fe transport